MVNVFQEASKRRKAGEDWKVCVQRVREELRQEGLIGKPRGSACRGKPLAECLSPCSWVKKTVTKKGAERKPHCTFGRQKKVAKSGQAYENPAVW